MKFTDLIKIVNSDFGLGQELSLVVVHVRDPLQHLAALFKAAELR